MNRSSHVAVGAVAGAGYAAYRARGGSSPRPFVEVLGGAVGGYLGARLPDIIDPPTSPRHRSIGHGVVPVTMVGVGYRRVLDDAQGWLRAEAERQRQVSQHCGGLESFFRDLWAAILGFASGFVAGLAAGYGSHVALDLTTPAGLPLFA